MVCTENSRLETKVCTGDSGALLQCHTDLQFTLVGLRIWDDECALKDKPTLFTRVGNFSSWIESLGIGMKILII